MWVERLLCHQIPCTESNTQQSTSQVILFGFHPTLSMTIFKKRKKKRG